MKENNGTFKKLIIAIGIPILVWGLSGLIVRDSREAFEMLEKPGITPPGWVFPVVWLVLYALMGITLYIAYNQEAATQATTQESTHTSTQASTHTSTISPQQKKNALILYGVQLVVNFFWPIIFFGYERYLLAFFWLVLLLVLIIFTIKAFYKISKPAAWLSVPYLLWVTFAGVFNLAIYCLN